MPTGKSKIELVKCDITIDGSRATIDGQYPLDLIRSITSYPVEGYRFSPAYRKGKWDGRKHLFDAKTKTFPAGLTSTIVTELKKYNDAANIRIIDNRTPPPSGGGKDFSLNGIAFGEGKYDYQLAAANALIKGKRGIAAMATNSGKTALSCAVTKFLALPTLFLVARLELLYQTRKYYSEKLGIPEDDIGIVGDSKFSIGSWITIATPSSLLPKIQQPEIQRMLNVWELVFADECHSVGNDTYYTVLDAVKAYYRFGLSGTPLDRSDGADLRLIAQTGDVLYSVKNKLLVERGISVQPHVEIVKIDKPILPTTGLNWRQVHQKGVVENKDLNTKAVEKAVQYAGEGRQCLILVEHLSHGKLIGDMLKKTGITHRFISGKESTDTRKEVLDGFQKGDIQCLMATSILDEGVDVPCIDCLILAAGGKAKIRLLQRVGRGLRSNEGKTKLQIVDFANFTHKWLLKHSLKRLQMYRDEECFVIKQST